MKNLYELENLRKSKETLRAVINPKRIDIINLIHSKGQINVTDLYTKLRIVQAIASQHLAILRKANIVLTERKGKAILYSINYEKIQEINAGAKKIIGII